MRARIQLGRKDTRSVRAPDPSKQPKHIAWLHETECPIYPGERPIVVHHLLRTYDEHGHRIIKSQSQKTDDRLAIPLCDRAHRELHDAGDEESFLARHGIDGRALGAALFRVTGDTPAGLRIVFRFHQAALLKRNRNAPYNTLRIA